MPDFRVRRSKATEYLPEIIDPLAEAWVEASGTARRARVLEAATHGQRLLCGYYFYRDDVTNGGHYQYFGNSTGNLWREALAATRVLRLPEQKILRVAVALFTNKQPAETQRERRLQLAAIDPA